MLIIITEKKIAAVQFSNAGQHHKNTRRERVTEERE